jgi:predicted component of type VI protein secretion system
MPIQEPWHGQPKLLLVVLMVYALSVTGCFTKKPPAAHLPAIQLGAAIVPATAEESADNPPDIPREPSFEFPQLVFGHSAPMRPRNTPVPLSEPARIEKPAEPTIAPEVPTEEVNTARNESQHNLEVAEKNLLLAAGKNLNPLQQDLVSKVHGFSDSAREAMKAGDWLRAKNLSKKAEVLSEQLASSL